ncbi:MAG: hypothetical protein LBD88_00540 [Candidatus Peribacteria bacterium]|jgi:hypothetical protein|nr:hypothetical protein [Candidatus Peribacteria bacterium]
MPNFLVSSREPLAIYSNFEIIDGEVAIGDSLKELYFYLSSNNNNVKNYVADFDINYDSDLN